MRHQCQRPGCNNPARPRALGGDLLRETPPTVNLCDNHVEDGL